MLKHSSARHLKFPVPDNIIIDGGLVHEATVYGSAMEVLVYVAALGIGHTPAIASFVSA